MQTKTCIKCGVEKTLDEFSKQKGRKLGVAGWCKQCLKKYYEENKEKTAERHKKYYEENKERIAEYGKKYYEENRVYLNNKDIYINTAPPELKPVLKLLIDLRKKKNLIKEIKNDR